jgi:nicotinate-nucleotide--dimethylbenzimidazole phosphoribosyltransferase
MKKFKITKVNESMRDAIQQKIDNLNKPKGSLGRLESLAMQICLIQQTKSPTLHNPYHLLFGGDHGIEREHVSVSPREITWQQMINFTHGGGGVNMFCRQHGFRLKIIDMGVDHDLTTYPEIINKKIALGTKNFLHGPAMSEKEFDQAIKTGASLVYDCYNEGSDIVSLGEMGIANTSSSSIWMSIFGNIPLDECVGAGAGLNSQGINHKYEILKESVDNFHRLYANTDPHTVIRYFGGFEMVGAIGAMLKAAELHLVILVDGFIMTACMLAASQIYPEILDYAIFAHCGDETGHQRMLQLMNAQPLLNLGMRLGEGTGAICAFPIVDSSVRMINEMNNFQNANITKYF